MADWDDFLDAADQWFVSYAIPPADIPVKLFAIGHSIELYLKATNAKLTGDIDRAIKFKHNIKKIWDDCKTLDQAFMPHYEIRNVVFNSDFVHDHAKYLGHDDRMHYISNQELYLIAKHLPDIKYIGAPLKSIKNSYSFGMVYPNPYWIDFLKELRSYLNHPQPGRGDWIRDHIDSGNLPVESIDYLKQLYV